MEGPARVIEDRQFSVETSGGYRPPSGLGERILIILAGLALLGGVLIVVTNLLPESEVVADSSPRPSAEATATPRPSRTPRPQSTAVPFPDPPPIIGLIPGTPDPQQPPEYSPGGWARVLEEVSVLASPAANASVVQVLEPGDVIRLDEYREDALYLPMSQPAPFGFVPTRVAGRPALDVRPDQFPASGFDIFQVLAAEQGYLALAVESGPYQATQRTLVSADGLTWTQGEPPIGDSYARSVISGGPAGWLALSLVSDDTGQQTWISRSEDGRRWDVLGRLDMSGYPIALVASREGYMLQVSDDGRSFGDGISSLWFSPDGRRWEQRPIPGNGLAEFAILGIPGGFLAWTNAMQGDPGPVSYSPDGFDWQATEGPLSLGLQVAPIGGDAVVALQLDPAGRLYSWTGTLDGGVLTWSSSSSVAFDGATVVGMAGARDGAMAIGWDQRRGEPRAWTTTGSGWQEAAVPEHGFGAQARVVVAGPRGYVVVGGRPSLQATNPVFWRFAGGTWRPEPVPVVPRLGDPDPADCPGPIRDALDYVTTPTALAVVCTAGQSVTFEAWLSPCDGCSFDAGGRFGEAWLANPARLIFLGPLATDYGGYSPGAVLAPGVEDPPESAVRLRVTGHWDDPAASRCTRVLTASDYLQNYGGWSPYWYAGALGSIQVECRSRFVITAWKALAGGS